MSMIFSYHSITLLTTSLLEAISKIKFYITRSEIKAFPLTLRKKMKDIYPTQNKRIFEVVSILLTGIHPIGIDPVGIHPVV